MSYLKNTIYPKNSKHLKTETRQESFMKVSARCQTSTNSYCKNGTPKECKQVIQIKQWDFMPGHKILEKPKNSKPHFKLTATLLNLT